MWAGGMTERDQPDLFSGTGDGGALDGMTAPYVRGSETSFAAALSVSDKVRGDALRVLEALRKAGEHGATVDEIERDLGMLHQTAGARMRGLVLAGFVRDSGRQRPTRSGRAAVVWEAVGPP